jgi:hypothetical protein
MPRGRISHPGAGVADTVSAGVSLAVAFTGFDAARGVFEHAATLRVTRTAAAMRGILVFMTSLGWLRVPDVTDPHALSSAEGEKTGRTAGRTPDDDTR